MANRGPKAPSYTTEIAQMLYVFGEVKHPDEATVRFIEEVVRGQVAELVVQARTLAHRRGSRMPTTEDLIFLIRHDRSKVNRLKTYLGWKDVRKRAREDGEGGERDIDAFNEDQQAGAGGGNGAAGSGMEGKQKGQMLRMRIPWDIATIYGDVLPEDEDDEDVDEMDREAYEASKRILREADELTRKMSKDEYAYYSECRQASFTYRKAKRFREFVGLANYLDGTPKDEVLDVLGFLACEVVRSLCERGLAVKSAYEASKAVAASSADDDVATTSKSRQRAASDSSPERASQASDSGAKRRKRDANTGPTNTPGTTLLSLDDVDESDEDDDGSAAFLRPPPVGLFTAPISRPTGSSAAPSAATSPKPHEAGEGQTTDGQASAAGEDEKEDKGKKEVKPAKTPLTVMDVEDAYAGMQTGRARMKMSGMRNFGGGLVRIKSVV